MTHISHSAAAQREADRQKNGQFGPSSAPEPDLGRINMGSTQRDEILDPTKIRASTLAVVQEDLALRVRHTDGTSLTLAESIEDGRVVAKSIVEQGSRNAYAVVIPDTTTDRATRNEAHLQVRKATWEALNLPRTARQPSEGPLRTQPPLLRSARWR